MTYSEENPLVSVVIPCYDSERFIGDAIESAIGQTYEPKEIIVVDDGSQDGSCELVRRFGAKVRLISKAHSGLPATRNAGYREACGTFVQNLDADDLIDPNKLERHVPMALAAGDRVVTIAGARVLARGEVVPSYEFVCPESGSDLRRACNSIIQTAMPLYWKRQIDALGGLREELPCNADTDFLVRLVIDGCALQPISEHLVTIRKMHDSMTSNPAFIISAVSNIVENSIRLIKSKGLHEMSPLADMALSAGLQSLKVNRPLMAVSLLRQARAIALSTGTDGFQTKHWRLLLSLGPSLFALMMLTYSRLRKLSGGA